jgi:tetratricopeptide (TPR) repeat protein
LLYIAFAVLLFGTDPTASQSLLKTGLLALQRGNLEEARQDLEQAANLDGNNAYVWTSLSQVYLRSGQREKAVGAAAKAESIAPENGTLLHALAMFYRDANDLAKAFALAERAEQKQDSSSNRELIGAIAFPYAQALLRREDFNAAASIAADALKLLPDDAELVLAMGVAEYGQRRFDEAIQSFLRAIRINPTIPQGYLFLSRMLDQAGPHLPEITADFEAWAAENPNNAAAKLYLAQALLATDPRSQRAGELLREAIQLDPGNWDAHYQLGVFLADAHRYSEAATELERSVELNPNEPMAHYHLARVYDRLGRGEEAKHEREIHARLTAGNGKLAK